MIHLCTTGQIKFPCVTKFYEMLFWHQNKLNGKWMFVFKIISSFQFVIKWCLRNFCLIKKWMMLEIVDKNVFEIMIMPIIGYLFAGFKSTTLFSAKIWFVKTSARMTKYESRVVKLNPDSQSELVLLVRPRVINFQCLLI